MRVMSRRVDVNVDIDVDGVEWSGVEWSGVEWSGVGTSKCPCRGVLRAREGEFSGRLSEENHSAMRAEASAAGLQRRCEELERVAREMKTSVEERERRAAAAEGAAAAAGAEAEETRQLKDERLAELEAERKDLLAVRQRRGERTNEQSIRIDA